MKSVLAFLVSVGTVLVSGAFVVGCCGVAPADGASHVDTNGDVHFDTTAVGASQTLFVPMEDSADVDETILSASVSGPGAKSFRVLSQFPLKVPAGTKVDVEIQFIPEEVGTETATLTTPDGAGMGHVASRVGWRGAVGGDRFARSGWMPRATSRRCASDEFSSRRFSSVQRRASDSHAIANPRLARRSRPGTNRSILNTRVARAEAKGRAPVRRSFSNRRRRRVTRLVVW